LRGAVPEFITRPAELALLLATRLNARETG